jgi:hypothetical protein
MTSGLHPGLVGPWEGCQAVRRELLGTLDADALARWRAPAAGGGCSLAQQVVHLLRAEIGTSKLVRKLIRGDFAGLARPRGAALHTSALAAYPYGRLPAPEGLEPADLAFEEAPERLAAAHERFLEELRRFPGPDADRPGRARSRHRRLVHPGGLGAPPGAARGAPPGPDPGGALARAPGPLPEWLFIQPLTGHGGPRRLRPESPQPIARAGGEP